MNKENELSALDALMDQIPAAEIERTTERLKLAARIADLIDERDLNKKQFAKLLGREPSVITKWLSGTHNFTIDTLHDICTCLGIQLANLFEERKPVVANRMHYAVLAEPSRYYGGGVGTPFIASVLPSFHYFPMSRGSVKITGKPLGTMEDWLKVGSGVVRFATQSEAIANEKKLSPLLEKIRI